MNKKKFVALIFPPYWISTGPHSALPSLSAYIKKYGFLSKIYDLNIKCINKILTKEFIDDLIVKRRLQVNKIEQKSIIDIDKSTSLLKNPNEFYNFTNYRNAIKNINIVYNLLSQIDCKCINDFEIMNINIDQFTTFNDLIENTQTIFDELLEEYLNDILKEKPILIGMSINCFEQLFFAVKISKLIKNKVNKCPVIVGGTYLSQLLNSILLNSKIINELKLYFDKIVIGDGEHKLLMICKQIEENKISSESIMYEKNAMFCTVIPDYDDIDFDKYLTPFPIICFPIAKGCSWCKCSFCSYNSNLTYGYAEFDMETSLSQIYDISKKYNCRHFEFTSSSVNWKYLISLSEKLIENDYQINWLTATRCFQSNEEQLKILKSSGCKKLLLGIESHSEKILKLMNKGIQPFQQNEFINLASNNKIALEAFFIYDFPNESINDLMETMIFLNEKKENIDSFIINKFVLHRNSPIYNNPQNYGIKIYDNTDKSLLELKKIEPKWVYQDKRNDQTVKKNELIKKYIQSINFHEKYGRYFKNPEIPVNFDHNFIYYSDLNLR